MLFKNNKIITNFSFVFIISVVYYFLTINEGITSENKFENAGFDDPKEAPRFLRYLQENLKSSKKEKIAQVVSYPLFVIINGNKSAIMDKNQFIEYFDAIFTSTVKEALQSEKPETLFVNSSGIMIGRGEIWFAQIQENDNEEWNTRIIKINNSTYKTKKQHQ